MKAASNNLFLQQYNSYPAIYGQLPYHPHYATHKMHNSTSAPWNKNRTTSSSSSSSPKFISPVVMASATPEFSNRPSAVIHARDRVIDFGKHKGNMLGTLPSAYLKWVSQNLRAGDTLQWAHLADQVLNDSVYNDRIEWEFAQKLLTGDSLTGTGNDSVAGLLELSKKFGWDNEDRAAWSKIDFALLGTSKSARIPRLDDCSREHVDSRLKKGNESSIKKPITDSVKRRDRIERSRLKRDEFNSPISIAETDLKMKKKTIMADNTTVEVDDPRSRFPGRASLVQKALNFRKNLLS